MPNGPMCYDPCYLWLENMMDEIEPDDEDDEVTLYFFDDEEEEEEDSWSGEDLI